MLNAHNYTDLQTSLYFCLEGKSHFNPLNPIVHFRLHHTVHCAEKIVSAHLHAGSASAERMEQREVGSLGTRPSKNQKGGSGTSAGVEVYTAEC